MSPDFLSVIVIAYNEENYISIILDSLANQTSKNFEVIVVDSNSTDNTEKIAKQFTDKFNQFTFHKLNCTLGPGYGRNRGAEVAQYERLLFLDADTKLPNDYIEKSLSEIKNRQLDIATSRIRIAENSLLSNSGAIFLNFFMKVLKPIYSTGYGACLFTKKSIHNQLSGFNEKLGICEDCNYIKRARRKYFYKYGILKPLFYTSDRRAKTDGGILFLLKYIKIHLYRMITGKEIYRNEIKYEYGVF